jgi:hypothetical protein
MKIFTKSACTATMLSALVFTAFSFESAAGELQVAYKTFYSHLRKLNDEETSALQFGFGFMNIHTKQLCEINSARISTQKQQIPISVTLENRFTLPSEKALRLADALVILDLTEATNICDISVQLETKPEYLKDVYAKEDLELIYQQYVTFFDDVGSFMSFLMPQVDGLTIQFIDKSLNTKLSNGMAIEKGILLINAEDLVKLDSISLPNRPLRVTAKTSD